jgi:hypothetical protein
MNDGYRVKLPTDHTVLQFYDMRERDHLEDPGVDGRKILGWIFRRWDVGAWTGLIWHRIGTGCGIL